MTVSMGRTTCAFVACLVLQLLVCLDGGRVLNRYILRPPAPLDGEAADEGQKPDDADEEEQLIDSPKKDGEKVSAWCTNPAFLKTVGVTQCELRKSWGRLKSFMKCPDGHSLYRIVRSTHNAAYTSGSVHRYELQWVWTYPGQDGWNKCNECRANFPCRCLDKKAKEVFKNELAQFSLGYNAAAKLV
eukprot:TRINITY_DN7822_c0_g4_i1.p1 TRINITY_DN7822_c0_g4~~TRINITY_DN7822_c0_g4_i1.p1  ORF type:complete len:187 (-),score=25.78 TRINITY_DN7822_c0_g4_i1:199-759(-)